MGAPAILAGASVGGSALSAVGQSSSASAQAGYYNYLSDTSTMNAGLAKAAGVANQQAVGAATADQMRRTTERVNQTVGRQQVSLVNGVGAGSRSAQTIVKNTLNQGELDKEAINMNAEMKTKSIFANADMTAFNDMNQAAGDRLAAENIKAALPYQIGSTLLGGAAQAGSSYAMMNMYSGGGGGSTIGGPLG